MEVDWGVAELKKISEETELLHERGDGGWQSGWREGPTMDR